MDGTNDLRIKELILAVNTGQLGPNGLKLVADCARFLMLDMKRKHAARKGILEFVHEFCKVPGHAGYDYLVLAFLEFEGLMNHGCSCRYGWLDGPLCDDDGSLNHDADVSDVADDHAAACVLTETISDDDAEYADCTATDAYTQMIAMPLEFHIPERELLWALMKHHQFSAEKRTAVMAAYELRHPVGKKSLPQHSDLQHLTLETPETSLDLARVVHWYEDACITAS